MTTTPWLIGVGSPLVDLLAHCDDEALAAHVPGAKGGMELVDAEAIAGIIEAGGFEIERAPGGAAANTTVGVACLGIPTAFVGSAGDDELGAYYRDAMVARGCEPRLVTHPELPNGRVLSLITPDAERTMRTCLGAAGALDPAAITAETFAGAKVVMLEGYTLFNHDLTRAVANAAKEAGCELALDLASFEVVQINKTILEELMDGRVDIVFANEDEAKAWKDGGELEALRDLSGRCKIAVVKVGKDGAWIRSGEEEVHVQAELVEAVDTTGAGDTWAAGFLAGYLRGCPLVECGKLGAKAGAAVVQVTGAQVPAGSWEPIRGYLDAWS
jgi:sugar/nucleoside kinase (ribokinase family)